MWRRDFTVNALYYDIADFSVIDYVGGVEDLRARRLRLIGDPATRYREDPVRMLRAIRFAAKLGLEIDQPTCKAFDRYGDLLDAIAPARLFDESLKMLHSGHGLETFTAMRRHDLFRHLFPLAEASFAHDPRAEKLVIEALKSTDERVAADKPVTPAFIFAAILWGALNERCAAERDRGLGDADAMQIAADEVVSEQVRRVAIPRRFTTVTREIWAFQPRLEKRTAKRAAKLLEHPRFRAAYDFLLLRVKAGEVAVELGDWWTALQDADEDSRGRMLDEKRGGQRRRSRPRRRRNR